MNQPKPSERLVMSQANAKTPSQPPYKVIKPGQTLPPKKAVPAKPQTTKQRIKASFRVSAAPFKSSRPGTKITTTKTTNAKVNAVCLELVAEFDLGIGGDKPGIEVRDFKMAHMRKEIEKLVESMGLVTLGSEDGSSSGQQNQKSLTLSEVTTNTALATAPKTAPKTSANATTKSAARTVGKSTAKTTAPRATGREHLQRQCNAKGKPHNPQGLET